jgi:hypothetical protein
LAETIWRLIGTGQTQQAVADELGWSRDRVAKFAALQTIDQNAWAIVTANIRDSMCRPESDVTTDVTPVTFSENLLRVLVPLSAELRVPSLSPTYAAMSESERDAAWVLRAEIQ